MAKILDKCINSADWVQEITKTMEFPSGYRPETDVITLEELDKISNDYNKNGGDMGLPNHWDYPLSETAMLATDEDKVEQTYVLVKFDDGYGDDEFRWCEM